MRDSRGRILFPFWFVPPTAAETRLIVNAVMRFWGLICVSRREARPLDGLASQQSWPDLESDSRPVRPKFHLRHQISRGQEALSR